MRRASLTALLRSRAGAGALEFALVLPPLLMLAFGIIEYGRLLWTKEALAQTAITGARCMGILQSPCASAGSYSAGNTTAYIQQIGSQWGLSIPNAGISLNQNTSCAGASSFSQVSLTVTFSSVVPKIVLMPLGGTTVTATACFPNNP